ncbi:unnamed protein product [Caenorhabditis bovis]|uniref:mitogen-activated protein kinase n=1 Tax=Caenorhabditis bovis TaxID=2654633 RepID=A0A8S1F0D7_9PELO|nr:unnamed protein product [Caenorhabditis bovis]
MGSKRGRGASSSNQERTRTHLFFASQPERHQQKRKRRAQNKLHSTVKDKKDEMVQAGASEIDPLQWTGNQRVLHFGPMAQRDPYFYYYPKGWDILYPAQFGFFPYRTTKFRGSSSLVCCCAFGFFLLIGGILMTILGYKMLYDSPFWTWPYEQKIRPPPIQIAGPILCVLGVIFLLISLVYFLFTTKLCDISLHHTKKHEEPSRVTTITTHYMPLPPIFEKDPYQPLPPPAYPVLENRHASTNIVKPHDEKKLYPPVIPGCSTLSLHRRSPNNIFVASPYNTLRATSVARYQHAFSDSNSILENKYGSRTASMSSHLRRHSNDAGEVQSPTSAPPPTKRCHTNEEEKQTAEAHPMTDGRQYKFVAVHGIQYAIPEAYDVDETMVSDLGGGTYGNVIKVHAMCQDGKRRYMAIKKLRDPFYAPSQARRYFREIRLLQLIQHDSIIRAVDLYTPDDEHDFKDIYVVTEYAGNSLYRLLQQQREHNKTILTPAHVKFIIYQLLRALKYIHSANVIHRDLKPGNLALTVDCDLTVLDFGLARSLEKKDATLTQYVQTRWYRSPEVIYWNIDSYTTLADMWSVGCIAAELLTGIPLFPGEDVNMQYEMITQLCGSPDAELLDKIERGNSINMRMVVESYPHFTRKNFARHFQYADPPPEFIDFLEKILVLDPEKRMTVEEAIKHPYMKEYYEPDDEPRAPYIFHLDDGVEKTSDEWRKAIWNEITNFKRSKISPRFN